MHGGALSGINVLDLANSAAGAWCARLLADFGADVTMVEPPSGHTLRHRGPFDPGGQSIPAAYFLADRRSVVLDLAGDDAGLARRLGRRMDVVISGMGPAALAARGIRYSDFEAPDMVMLHVTPWGVSGELADAAGNDLAVAARSGWAAINGRSDREPLKPSGWQVSYCTGTAAFVAVLAALYARDEAGAGGQEVDVAALDVMAAAFSPGALRSAYTGRPWRRRTESDLLAGPVPVADGFFALTISRAHFWRDAMNLLGLTDLAEDQRWETAWYRQVHKDEYVARVQEKMLNWPRWKLFAELALRRVIAGPVASMGELYDLDHLRARGFWRRPLSEPNGPLYPGPPFRMSGTPATFNRPTPSLDDDGVTLRERG
ncbi:MAG: CoA transferase [Dehalococcoidia bacterium]